MKFRDSRHVSHEFATCAFNYFNHENNLEKHANKLFLPVLFCSWCLHIPAAFFQWKADQKKIVKFLCVKQQYVEKSYRCQWFKICIVQGTINNRSFWGSRHFQCNIQTHANVLWFDVVVVARSKLPSHNAQATRFRSSFGNKNASLLHNTSPDYTSLLVQKKFIACIPSIKNYVATGHHKPHLMPE